MTTVEEIEKAIVKLSAPELDRQRDWFEEFKAARFDEKIEHDAKAGKLGRLAEEALAEHRKGRSRELRGISRARRSEGPCQAPAAVRELADKNYALLKENPQHPSLHLKKVGRYWVDRPALPHAGDGVDDGLL